MSSHHRALSCGERAILSQDGDADEGGTDARILRQTEHIARRDLGCDGCEFGFIKQGEAYSVTVMLVEREFESRRHCASGRSCNCPQKAEDEAARQASEARDRASMTTPEALAAAAANPWGAF